MANPSSRWDFIPVWGIYLNPVTNQPTPGVVSFSVSSRITRVDGRIIYPEGATVAVTVGSTGDQDSTVRESIRAAWRAYDEANEPSFDGSAWDVWWSDTIVPALICTRFPASDDPDIVQTGYSVTVKEALASGAGKQYAITPLLSHLDTAIPGINLGTIEVPPGSPTVPAPMYAKGVAGGVASLDAAAKVPLEQIPDGVVGASTVAELTDAGTAGKAVVQAETAADARDVIGAQPAGSYATAAQGALAETAAQLAEIDAVMAAQITMPTTETSAALSSTYAALSNHRRGSGSPVGVVTPTALGQVYADTAQTLGARLWISTGTTSADWKILDGDTGWRNIAASIGSDWTVSDYLEIRRVNQTVWMRGKILRAAASGTRVSPLTVYATPTGFKATRYVSYGPCYCTTAGSVGVLGNMSSVSNMETRGMAGNWALNDAVVFGVSWTTAEAWPTSLPGSAA